mmetsp:Transcript_72772/g.131073  ORF Transcript_72772/g.131073 Transcript_72772/m.131073 type:complete len:493 (+) Transcript_72772:458-1936(+)
MSGGDYVSLGFFEREDLDVVVDHLRQSRQFTRVGLWGTSMGAATSVMQAAHDPTLAGVVADSPFSDLWELIQEICSNVLNLPKLAWSPLLQGVRLMIQKQAGFDICEVSPQAHVGSCFVPALFLHGEEDTFVLPHHSEKLRSGWQGEASHLVMPDTDHNSRRGEKFIARASLFFVRAFRWEAHVPEAALMAISAGLSPNVSNQKRVQLQNSPASSAEQQMHQLAVTSSYRDFLMSPDESLRQRGLVLAAAELSGAYRGAESLPLASSGGAEGSGSAHLRTKLPACFRGQICLGSDEVEVALAWVAGELQNSGHCVYFAVLSSRLISLSRVIVRQVIGPSGSFDGLHCDGVEPLGMESVELAPGRSVDFELRMPGGLGAELHVDGVMVEAEFDGVVGGGSVQLPSSVEPQGWYWRPSGLADNSVHVNLSPSVDVPPASPKRHNRSSTASFGALGSKEHFAGTLATLCLGPSCRHATLPVAGSLLTEDGHANWS